MIKPIPVSIVLIVPIVSMLLMMGCGSLLPNSAGERTLYTLVDEGSNSELVQPAIPKRLVLRGTRANTFLGSQKIVFSNTDNTRGFYQYASWVEPPPDRFVTMLLSRFDASRVFESVTRIGSAMRGDFQLNTELLELLHDARNKPGVGVVAVSAELIDSSSGVLLGRKEFRAEIGVSSYDAKGAVVALSSGLNEVATEITTWVITVAATQAQETTTEVRD